MKTFLPGFLLMLFTGAGLSGNAQHQHSITFQNLDGKKGTLYIGWYNRAEDFRKSEKAVISRKVPVDRQESVTVNFDNIETGKYAVAVFFDRDGDGKLNTNVLGIPKEKYGFSNNVYPAMRAARFSEAAFDVKANGSQLIHLK